MNAEKRGLFRRSRWLVFFHDMLWVPVALFFAFWLRFNLEQIPAEYLLALQQMLLVTMPLQWGIFWLFGLYRGIWRYASIPDVIRIFKAVATGFALTILVTFIYQRLQGVPRSVLVLYPLFLTLGLLLPRLFYRWLKERRLALSSADKRIIILGAGQAGEMIVRDILKGTYYQPVGLLDDDPGKAGMEIHGIRVLGRIDRLEELLATLDVDEIFFAIPSASAKEKRRIISLCAGLHVHVRILPSPDQLESGQVELSSLREIELDDLLGRNSVVPDKSLIERSVAGKTVMVTGAGGSIGSELCRQIVLHRPGRVVLFELNEFALYNIEQELGQALAARRQAPEGEGIEILPILGSVCDRQRVEKVCRTFRVETVYHAAAYKHVPLVEYNPFEAVRNNVFGTLHSALAAMAAGVETFVLISTDKAVRPTNVMGASKRLAELILQALSDKGSDTRFCMVRFGNVLGSSGSVVPLFSRQIRQGGPVTLTHADITRYFMSIPEAAQLVIQAGAMGRGGDVFVLDMGEPVRIIDLARQMIHLSGLSVRDADHPDGDIEIRIDGLRPGEKLYEELLIGEHVTGTDHPLIMRASEEMLDWDELEAILKRMLEASANFDAPQLRSLLLQAVKGYQPQGELHDLTWTQKNGTAAARDGRTATPAGQQPR